GACGLTRFAARAAHVHGDDALERVTLERRGLGHHVAPGVLVAAEDRVEGLGARRCHGVAATQAFGIGLPEFTLFAQAWDLGRQPLLDREREVAALAARLVDAG